MNRHKPIILIDDDTEDLELFKQVFQELEVQNEIICFTDGQSFLNYMKTSKIDALFILCDVNMGKMNGMALKKIILDDEELRLKCIPFIFLSTSTAAKGIKEAYSLCVQGYFVKPFSYDKIKTMFQSMLHYWGISQVPAGPTTFNFPT